MRDNPPVLCEEARMARRFRLRVATVLAVAAGLCICACGDGDAGPGDVLPDVQGDVSPDAEATDVPPAFAHRVLSFSLPDGLAGIATGDFRTPSHEFAPLVVDAKYTHVLNFHLTAFTPPYLVPLWTWGPVVLYSDDLDVLVVSPMDHFHGTILRPEDGRVRLALHGDLESVPAGFVQRYLVVEGRGIGATLTAWGDLLLEDRGRARADRYADAGLSTLGYWTDNGAWYYYRTEEGMTFEETLLAVRAEADRLGIPYGHMQIDSWWYPKRPGTLPGENGGTITWEPLPEVFPRGLPAFVADLGLPLVAHNRWYAPDTPYRDRYLFVDGDGLAFPVAPEFFAERMANAKAWGIETYEQDWFSRQWWRVPWLRAQPDRGQQFVANIADAARAEGLTVQMCMAEGAQLLSALDHPNVTTFRASVDYATDLAKEAYWPQFTTTGMVAWALGVWPFKDNFQSAEKAGQAEALVANLSGGIVGVGDGLGRVKPDIVLPTCRADGRVLKPDRPAFPVDRMFLTHRRPWTTATFSDRPGVGRWDYLAAYLIASQHEERTDEDRLWALVSTDPGMPVEQTFVFPEVVDDWRVDLAADLGIEGRRVAYDWRSGTARVVAGTFDLAPIQHLYGFSYQVLAPVFDNGLALIGETGKYVTLADRRFTAVQPDADAIRVDLAGKPGEVVRLQAYDADAGVMLPAVDATIGADGTVRAVLSR